MADDMMKKEVKTTRQDDVVAGRVRVFDESFHDGCLFFETAHVTLITKRPRII